MNRKLLANGREIKRSQLKAKRRFGITVKVGFRDTDGRTGKIIKRPTLGKGGRS
jgi:hypothetical protein